MAHARITAAFGLATMLAATISSTHAASASDGAQDARFDIDGDKIETWAATID